VRYANAQNEATHFANVVFETDEGELQVFSRSGINGRLEIIDASILAGPKNYGAIRGAGNDKTGYYSRTQKRK
jgi:hypothetical protein